MRYMKAIYLVLAAISLNVAQPFNISGTVKDVAGAPVAGALVKLERTGNQTLSGADGRFTLTENSTSIGKDLARPEGLSATVTDGSLWITLAEKSEVSVVTYGLEGTVVSTVHSTLEAGTQSLALPKNGPGLFFHKVRSGGSEMMIRCFTMAAGGTLVTLPGSRLAPMAKEAAIAAFPDFLAVSKTGFLDYRTGANNPNATGLEIRLIASAGTVTDADGNVYQTVKLGNQTWTTDHFRSTKYNDGTAIPQITEGGAWANRTAGAYCFYNNSTNADTNRLFGALYNWHAVNTGKMAPAGWRLPSNTDWTALESYLIANGFNHDGTNTGNKIAKSMSSQVSWNTSAVAGAVGNDMSKNNKSGYNGMPIGFRLQTGTFTGKGGRNIIQSTTEYAAPFGWFADIDATAPGLRRSDDWKVMGFSVRLVKN